jgi:hypothetical protein
MNPESPGWNTYDPLGMNRIVRFPELYEIRLSVFAPEQGAYTSKFYHLEHFGEAGNVIRANRHSSDCSYASAELSFAGFIFRVEYASADNGTLACSVQPIAVGEPFTILLVEVLRAWTLGGEVDLDKNNTISFPSAFGGRVTITAMQEDSSLNNPGTPVTAGVYASEEEFLDLFLQSKALNGICGSGGLAALGFNARIPLLITAGTVHNSDDGTSCNDPREIELRLRTAKNEYECNTPKIRGGPFEGSYQAVCSVMNWMTVWDQLHGIPYAPVSRSWIDNYMVRMGFDTTVRGPLTGLWDSFFHAILQSVNDRSLAEANLRVVLGDHALMEEGYPTNYMVSAFMSGDRSQPPLGALAAWKLYRRFGNLEFLEWIYPRLKRWREWWKTRRDGNADGLLEWGSNIETDRPGNDAGTLFAAKCESGMDNSPLYDDARYDRSTGTMNLFDVGLNAMFAADAMYLAAIAGALGKTAEQETLDQEYRQLVGRIESNLWNEQTQAYADKFWNGEFSSRMGPTIFFPLLARIPNEEKAAKLVRAHLVNQEEFWGEYVIPTISRNDSAFKDQLYWRGRVWPPVNYLVYLGLKAYGFDDVAHQLALRSVRLFMREWKLRGHCHENYNAITGEGDDVPVPAHPGSNGSDRFYPWGALLALMGIEELFDIELDTGIRFGCRLLENETHVSGIAFAGDSYRVTTSSAATRAWRNDHQFFCSFPGTTVRNYRMNNDSLQFSLSGNGPTTITISEFPPLSRMAIHHSGKEISPGESDAEGSITFTIELAAVSTRVTLTW